MTSTDPYYMLIHELPLPSPAQTASFAEYVASSHSWYKHLPCFPPGQKFRFFLDPSAGRDLIHTPGGEMLFEDNLGKEPKFHYSEMTTAEYRQRFGYWNYSDGNSLGPHVEQLMFGPNVVRPRPSVLGPDGDWLTLPEDMAKAGTCRLTGFVHERCSLMLIVINSRAQDHARRFVDFTKKHADHPDIQRYLPLLKLLMNNASKKRISRELSRTLDRFVGDERHVQQDAIRHTLNNVVEFLRSKKEQEISHPSI